MKALLFITDSQTVIPQFPMFNHMLQPCCNVTRSAFDIENPGLLKLIDSNSPQVGAQEHEVFSLIYVKDLDDMRKETGFRAMKNHMFRTVFINSSDINYVWSLQEAYKRARHNWKGEGTRFMQGFVTDPAYRHWTPGPIEIGERDYA